jgi:hypothetical protein
MIRADKLMAIVKKPSTTLVFTEPAGRSYAVVSAAEVRNPILESDDAFWKCGSGEAQLSFRRKPQQATLTICFKKNVGFMLLFMDNSEGDLFVTCRGADYRRKASLFSGGDYYKFPIAFFVSDEEAWKVVTDFVESGQRSAAVSWKRRLDINAFEPDECPNGEVY